MLNEYMKEWKKSRLGQRYRGVHVGQARKMVTVCMIACRESSNGTDQMGLFLWVGGRKKGTEGMN